MMKSRLSKLLWIGALLLVAAFVFVTFVVPEWRFRRIVKKYPKGTPAEVVGRLNAAANAAMADPATRQRIADLGMDLPAAELQTPAAFAAFHKAEIEKWFPIVKAAGVKPE